MSCQMNNIAQISIVDIVKSRLSVIEPGQVSTSVQHTEDNWEWEWQEELESVNTSSSTPTKDSTWLQKCQISLSPTGKVLAIAHKHQIVILNAYLESQNHSRETKTEYNIVSHGDVCLEPGEEITAVLCVPLLSQLKSSPSGTDWTCIVVGYSTGHVRFYTEDKKLLAGEQFHGEAVNNIKCQSYKRATHSAAPEQPEELYVMYTGALVTLPGFSLFQTLRACRNQLARVQANCSREVEAPPLAHTKWGITEQQIVRDCQVIGSASANTFDHLMTASLCGGFEAMVKSSAPAHSLVIATGRKPYVGYHFTFEGNNQPILLGVARAMANSIKTSTSLLSLKSFLTGSKQPPEKKITTSMEPPEPMGCRFGICDSWRQGESIIMSPSRALSVICDTLGRVLLLDNQKGTALRMWKGYRDAQCGWIEVKEPSRTSSSGSSRSKHRQRVALFLAIYAPKKGVIEVWAMQQGPKVASFSVSKGGRLLYTNYGHLGVNNIPIKGSSKSQFPCIFLDPSGALKDITVPFHFSLSAQNSKQARDMHLLKKIKELLRSTGREDADEEEKVSAEVGQLVKELHCSEAGLQALDLLAVHKCTKPIYMLSAISVLKSKLENRDPESMDHGSKTLQHTCNQFLKLVDFFVFLQEQSSRPPSYELVVSSEQITPEELSSQLLAPEMEILSLLKLAEMIDEIIKSSFLQPRVTFQDDAQSLFPEFLSCFELSPVTASEKRPFSLKKNLSDEKIKRTSLKIFQGWLHSDSPISEWLATAEASGIQAQSLLHLALHFWLQSHHNRPHTASTSVSTLGKEMLRYFELIKAICFLADEGEILFDCNELSKWWYGPRTILVASDKTFRALTAAVVCRAVGLCIEGSGEAKGMEINTEEREEPCADGKEPLKDLELTPTTGSDWERLSMETLQWNMLVRQLEDLALLDAVLQWKAKLTQNCMPHCLRWKASSVSLYSVLNKGKGSVSELVAGWLASIGLNVHLLIDDKEDGSFEESQSTSKKELEIGIEATSVDREADKILALIDQLRQRFPYSLAENPLLASLFWEHIQDRVQIINTPAAAETSLEILCRIPSPHLRQGMCNLLWSLYLKQDFEKIARSLNKKSKPPQLEEIGLHEGQLPFYLDFCVKFLEAFLEANEETEVATALELNYEEMWEGPDVPPSLSQVALSKAPANFALIELHLQLATVMHMVAFFDLKLPKDVFSLFDSAGQAALFLDLSARPRMPNHNPDQKLTLVRTQFLFRVVSASMQTIVVLESECPSEEQESSSTVGPKVDATAAAQWMRKCLVLANTWTVSCDAIRRHQICDLYMTGYDRLAEEIIPSICEEAILGSQLLLIAGQRLQIAITNSSNLGEKMANISPALSTWLCNVGDNILFCPSSLADTTQLAGHVLRLLPEEHLEYGLAQLLLDSCNHLCNFTDVKSES